MIVGLGDMPRQPAEERPFEHAPEFDHRDLAQHLTRKRVQQQIAGLGRCHTSIINDFGVLIYLFLLLKQ